MGRCSHGSGCSAASYLSAILIGEVMSMKFQRIEFSWRAAFIGFYMTPERDKVWITLVPFLALYFKRVA